MLEIGLLVGLRVVGEVLGLDDIGLLLVGLDDVGDLVGVPVALEMGLDVGGPGVLTGEEVVGREVIGWAFGEAVGLLVRATTGLDVGKAIAPFIGDVVGTDVLAFFVGDVVGGLTGAVIIGAGDGAVVGAIVVGSIVVTTATGLSVGRASLGTCEIVGIIEIVGINEVVGCGVEGDTVGLSLGRNVGDLVGEKVTEYE
mmetsp:Transcript_25332/g.45680  ORF Transcript_25332/g.45680 Transcript_25332/m.45680 type:complete len:198 (-) Transcript_25332:1042-1635(-)